jgi:hypothetical protein
MSNKSPHDYKAGTFVGDGEYVYYVENITKQDPMFATLTIVDVGYYTPDEGDGVFSIGETSKRPAMNGYAFPPLDNPTSLKLIESMLEKEKELIERMLKDVKKQIEAVQTKQAKEQENDQ